MGNESPPSPDRDPSSNPENKGFGNFWAELKRRKVVRVAITYAIVAWLIIQVANATFSDFGIPVWAYRFVVVMLALFFPVAIILAWAFELTPNGIMTTKTANAAQHGEPLSRSQQRKRNWTAYAVGALLPTLVFGALALYFYVTQSDMDSPPLEQIQPPKHLEQADKSIAVLPLENMSPDPENAFFADGVQEDILTHLSKIKELGVVISRSSTLKYRDSERNLKQVGQELGVRYLVEGSVRRVGSQVLVTVQLIDSLTDDHIWAENYNRELTDIFAIQAEVAREIAQQLKAAISPEEIEKIEYRPTQNQEAYDAYVRARQAFEETQHRGQSYVLVKEAVRLDPKFAQAWAFLAYDAIVRWNFMSRRTNTEYLATATRALAEAERLAPDTPIVLFARSTYFTHHEDDRRSAISLLLRAISMDPSIYLVRWELGILYHNQGLLPEARLHYEVSLKSDPLSSRSNHLLTAVYEKLGLWDEARTLIEKNIERSGRPHEWRLKLAQSEFLRTGKEQPLLDAWKSHLNRDNIATDLWLALQARDYRRIIDLFNEADFQPDNTPMIFSSLMSLTLPPDLVLALAWYELGDLDKARSVTEAGKLEWEGYGKLSALFEQIRWNRLAAFYALEGRRGDVDRAVSNARKASETSDYAFTMSGAVAVYAAIAYLILDDKEKAIQSLEEVDPQTCALFLNRELQLWPFFDRLRGNPRFDALLQ